MRAIARDVMLFTACVFQLLTRGQICLMALCDQQSACGKIFGNLNSYIFDNHK